MHTSTAPSASLELADAIAAAERLLDNFVATLEVARDRLDTSDRVVFTRHVTKRLASECARARWIILGTLSPIDAAALKALVALEPVDGGWFRTTGAEVWAEMECGSYQVAFVALRRLHDLGLIERISGRGNAGTRVRVNWDRIAREYDRAKAAT